jgi:UDP-hydrolysing UDP-N-acetyl-D-glucosamine 2-epimerase
MEESKLNKLKIAAITSTRADYGLLYPLIKKMEQDDDFQLDLVVTGTHLSDFHGKTIDRIEKDGFKIRSIIRMNQASDKEGDLCGAIGEALVGFSNYLYEFQPDAIILLGDRYELMSFCMGATIHKVPIIHLHGGEATYGVMDDAIRHAVTKMAAIHFPSLEAYGKRIIQMGESPKNVYVVGALGIDNIKNIELMDEEELFDYTGVHFSKNKIALMTFHPATLDDYEASSLQVREILEALRETDYFVLMTMPNADTGGKSVYEVKKEYTACYKDQFKLIKSLGQRGYLSAMKYAKCMIGNSSSGILESASFQLPVINIGDRQEGRFKPLNIVDTPCKKETILKAIKKIESKEFVDGIQNLKNPYGDGHAAERIIKVLKGIDLKDKNKLLKKGFFDLDCSIYN